ncbi:hypothetical protein GCM10011379_11010 [Filimonas zeae]|uniref:Outer membrane protein beta-barrel domain-containing protein n=2 Tax=Filimonas zeae TaxID=1737353 RepID=A0A917IRP1_9BACT|nr:hypothetical protein GCM10011379_11010 [Filimonas zeae]
MKRMKLLLLLCLFQSIHANAQYFGFGFKGGTNLTRFDNGFGRSKNNIPIHFGTMTYFGINGHLGMQLEILYSRQSANFSLDTFDFRVKVNYITFPLLLRYKHPSGFFANAGPQINMKVSQSLENVGIPWEASEVEYAASLGVGYRHPAGLGIECRYVKSFTKQDIIPDTGKRFGFRPYLFQVSLICLLLFD